MLCIEWLLPPTGKASVEDSGGGEELQSTNEELATVNEELQIKTAETQELNIELESIQNLSLIHI